VLRKRKEVKDLDASKTEAPLASERRDLPQQARKPAGQIDEPSGGRGQNRIEKRGIEPFARGVDDRDIRPFEHLQPVSRRTGMDRRSCSMGRGEGLDSCS